MLIKVTDSSRLGLTMPTKSLISALRSYYQRSALNYDTYLGEELSLAETKSFLSLISEDYHDCILDVASGTGRISQEISSRGLYYVGLDISDSMLLILRRKTPMQDVDLVCGSATNLPFKTHGLPLVACFGLTGYFDSRTQRKLMFEIAKAAIAGGRVVIDFLRPSTGPAKLIRNEEAIEGNRVYLLSLTGIQERIRQSNFKIIDNRKTPRQVQFLLRKSSGKD